MDALPLGINLVLAVRLVPFGHRGGLVHVLDDLAPADSSVVRAERDFALLRCIRDDAHLGPSEVVVEKVLEPHAADDEGVPRIGAPFQRILKCPVGARIAV